VFFDLEDAVPQSDKSMVRKKLIEFLSSVQAEEKKRYSVRINSSDTAYAYSDVIALLESCYDKIESLIIPKVDEVNDIIFFEKLIEQIERKLNRKANNIALEIMLESAKGLLNLESILQASKRIRAVHFGSADFAASMKFTTTRIGHMNETLGYNTWSIYQQKMIATCRAYEVSPIDGPYDDVNDNNALRAICEIASALGFDGKWAINPKQLEIINEVFLPKETEYNAALRILEIYRENDCGASQIDGKMIDAASVKLAQNIIDRYGNGS